MLFVANVVNAGWQLPNWLSGNDSYDEGIEYIKITPSVKASNKKVEVKELFWYYCPHCFTIDDKVSEWKSKQTDDVEFVRQPAVFSKQWMSGSDFFYIMKDLGVLEKLHKRLFNEIHVKNNQLETTNDFLKWLIRNGVPAERTKQYKKSFAIKVKTNQARRITPKYQIKGVPTFIVDGKYRVSSTEAGSQDDIFKVLDYLVNKVKAEREIK